MIFRKYSIQSLAMLAVVFLLASCAGRESVCPTSYDSVAHDPLNVRIYKLDNGLTVYMSPNPDEPKIQGSVVVRVGSKNDPSETTGLSHYLEHLMFKGTSHFGTSNYEVERKYLDEIRDLYELHRSQTDPQERAATYRKIDSVSQIASTYAIPNEYDKLMSSIGSTGTNAYTSNDATVYVEYFPKNQLESWAKVQGDRFSQLVMRGFHTELEAVYEEKNISLDNDNTAAFDSLQSLVFSPHPYGTQTTLGTQEHLKSPSLVNIQKHFDTYYVPNNMAVCLSGDFDPDEAIKVINAYFGKLKPKKDLPAPIDVAIPEKAQPKVVEVSGEQPANVMLGWVTPGSKQEENIVGDMLSLILSNGSVGLIDANLNQSMKVLNAYAFQIGWADHDIFVVAGYPQQEQTLEQVKDLLLEQVAKLRNGDFDEEMLKQIVTNEHYQFVRDSESNRNRAELMGKSFISGRPWEEFAHRTERMAKITKQQVVDFANKYLKDSNYSLVYKRRGPKANIVKIQKPPITPIKMNRDSTSQFVKDIQAYNPTPIEPVFVDFKKDIDQYDLRDGVVVLQSQNKTNELFSVQYIFEMGKENSRTIDFAASFSQYLGSEGMSLNEFKAKLFALGCDYALSVDDENVDLNVYGLSKNMREALMLIENHLKTLVPEKSTYADYVGSVLQQRANVKSMPRAIFSALEKYVEYGPKNPFNTTLNNDQLVKLDPKQLTDELRTLFDYPHYVSVYSPNSKSEVVEILNAVHPAPESPKPLPKRIFDFKQQVTKAPKVYYVPSETEQVQLSFSACRGENIDVEIEPVHSLFNAYFGGSMNSIVFQEIRESKALAYSSYAGYTSANLRQCYRVYAFIGTQADKLPEAVVAMRDILTDMPRAEKTFDFAKDAVIANLRTSRMSPRSYANGFLVAKKRGIDYDLRKLLFEKVPGLTYDDLQAFYEQRIRNNIYNYAIMGDPDLVKMDLLEQYGPVQKLTLEEIFGF